MIYDCFIFFNELDILDIRLNMLDKYVDKFVLVESRKTFTLKDKPLYYEENKHLFEKFNHKIIHVVTDFGGHGEWANEALQRDAVVEGLTEAADNDLVLFSDIDEIPNLEGFDFGTVGERVIAFRQHYYYYYLNNKMSFVDYMTRVCRVALLREKGGQGLRATAADEIIENGGWHFSYMGGVERILHKIESFSHQDLNLPQFNNAELLAERIAGNRDLFDRSHSFEVVPVETLPAYIVENQERFRHLLK